MELFLLILVVVLIGWCFFLHMKHKSLGEEIDSLRTTVQTTLKNVFDDGK